MDWCRDQIALSLCRASGWFLAGVSYAFATGPPCKTLRLLELLTERIVDQASGPRWFAGDFNLTLEQLPLKDYWRSRGFVELQDVRAVTQGLPPECTCKHSTRKDCVWVSREMIPFLSATEVSYEWFPDHALLTAEVRMPGLPAARLVWPSPCQRPAADFKGLELPSALDSETAEMSSDVPVVKFGAIWQSYERRLDLALRQAVRQGYLPVRGGVGRSSSLCLSGPNPRRIARAVKVRWCQLCMEPICATLIGSNKGVGFNVFSRPCEKAARCLQQFPIGLRSGTRF